MDLRTNMNKISELQAKQGNVEVEAKVTDLSGVRSFEKFGEPGRVCNATIQDDTGSVTLTLWNEQVDQVKEGDTVHVTNGYVSEWQGQKQLSTGKYGKLEIVGADGAVKGSTKKAPGKETKKSSSKKGTSEKGSKDMPEEDYFEDEESDFSED